MFLKFRRAQLRNKNAKKGVNEMKGLGMFLLILGISAADTECLLIPFILVAAGMIMVLKGNENGKRQTRR